MTLDEATTAISQISYKPGWRLSVARTPWCPHLLVERPDAAVELIPLPLVALRYMTELRLVQWVFNWVRDIEARAADAAFQYAGKTVDEIEGP